MNSRRGSQAHLTSQRRTGAALVAAAVAASLLAGCGTRLEREDILAGGTISNGGGSTVGSNDAAATGDFAAGGGVADPATDEFSVDAGAVDGGTTGDPAAAGAAAGSPGSGAATASGGGAAAAGGAATSGGGGFATGPDAAIFGGKSCTKATKSPVVIGNVSTLSGVLGELFSPVVPALQTFVKAQNDCGGLNGHPIKLIIGDDRGDPSTARSVASRQINNDKVIAFVGNIQVLTIDAMVDLVTQAQIPMIGGDITNNTWFSSPIIFPQGPPPQSIGYGYVEAALRVYGKKKLASVYCAEVPQACSQIDQAFRELAPKLGAQVVNSTRISITAPSYQSQCVQLQNDGAELVALTFDAAAQARFTNDCAKVNYKPNYVAYPLGVGNEKQFLGNRNLGNTYVPLNAFAWMANETPAEKFYQASVKRYNPGFTSGNAASLGWVAGALAVAGSAKLGDAPTSAQFLEGLYSVKNNNLGGLAAPLTFNPGKAPKIPYCLFGVKSNPDNTGWEKPTSKATCVDLRAPSDPNQ